MQQFEATCSALQEDKWLKSKLSDLEGHSRRQNILIVGLPASHHYSLPSISDENKQFERHVKKGEMEYHGHKLRFYKDYSADVLKQRVEYKDVMAELYERGL